MLKILKIFAIISFCHSIFSQEKFEALIATVNSEVVTTYDLSQRIQLALKSLQLEDTIKNRDSVRERVLELLILEKIKNNEAVKNEVSYTDDELIQFASILYNFPKDKFEDFKSYIETEELDIDVLFEQLSSELLWKKLVREKFSSLITINENEIDKAINEIKQKQGKIEYNLTEILFESSNKNYENEVQNKIDKFLSLLDQGISFSTLAKKFSDSNTQEIDENLNWVFEENLDDQTRGILMNMKSGEISNKIKIENGYKIIKLNKKRIVGNKRIKYSFIKISSLFADSISLVNKELLKCNEPIPVLPDDISAIKIEDVYSNELSDVFRQGIEATEKFKFSRLIENNGEFSLLMLCSIDQEEKSNIPTRDQIENKLYTNKFNQLTNTFIANLRKNANIKFFNK